MRSIELFAGAGGLGMGVSRAGFEPAAVIEWDHHCCDTIRKNQARRISPEIFVLSIFGLFPVMSIWSPVGRPANHFRYVESTGVTWTSAICSRKPSARCGSYGQKPSW